MAELRTVVPPSGTAVVRPVRIRPQLGPDLSSADGRADLVAVDQALRGQPVDLNKAELEEVCRILTELRIRFHGVGHTVRPNTVFNDRSPYRQLLELVPQALGMTLEQFHEELSRYRERTLKREQRADARRQQVSDAVAALYPLARIEVDSMSGSDREQMRLLAVEVIGSETDTLVAGGKRGPKPKDKPSPLGAVAKGVALLAQSPGGVVFLGLHYCVDPHGDCPGRRNGVRL